jgi:hypothetical protein
MDAPMDRPKRELRQEKRDIKRAGNKHRRQRLKRSLAEDPESAPFDDPGFGRHRSAGLNGLDRDATRRRPTGKDGATPDEG